MTDQPRISVVIATRNRRPLLQEAVASVRLQQGVSWEMVIVDDASTDDTWSYLTTLDDARSIRLDAHGERSRARNRGLAEAQGRYVMFLDDDDFLHTGALATLSRELDRHPSAVAAVGAREDWFVAEGYRRRDIHPLRTRLRPLFDELLFGWSAVSGQNLFRVDVVREIGGYDTTPVLVEDRVLWLRVARRGPVVLCPKTVMTYRIPPTRVLPADIREQRERVARNAIRDLPQKSWRRALTIRRCTNLVDRAENDVVAGSPWMAVPRVLQAAWLSPGLMLSPLIATWVARRLIGRAYHRYARH